MKTLAILGSGGHGKVVAETALASGKWNKIVFFDDAWSEKKENNASNVVGDTDALLRLSDRPDVVVAIGNNKARLQKQEMLIEKGFSLVAVIHPFTAISTNAKIGLGSVIMAGAIVNADASIGTACIINSNAVVEHDCTLGSGVHISPGANIAGGVAIGDYSWVGIGASVIQRKNIGKNVIIGAGATVIKDLPDNVTAVGVPAKIIKNNEAIC